jgi:hypothetical protein
LAGFEPQAGFAFAFAFDLDLVLVLVLVLDIVLDIDLHCCHQPLFRPAPRQRRKTMQVVLKYRRCQPSNLKELFPSCYMYPEYLPCDGISAVRYGSGTVGSRLSHRWVSRLRYR